MEPLFDKDIDAILRASRSSIGMPTPAAAHVDADAIAAFVENALPEKTRLTYTAHFADCDDCRKKLAVAVSLRAPETQENVVAAALPETTKVPWYSGLLRSPGLAAAFGVLLLAFAVGLGYLVLQTRQAGSDSTIARNIESEPAANIAAPAANIASAPEEQKTADAETAATPSNMIAANTTGTGRAPGIGTGSGSGFGAGSGAGSGDVAARPETEALPAPPPSVMSAPAQPAAAPPVPDDARAAEISKEDNKDLALRKRKETEDSVERRDVPPPAAKSGPTRSGPVQMQANQVQLDGQAGRAREQRSAGGRTFENVNGVWTDTAYRGQATTGVRRGSDDYKKLDSGLRSIAERISGTIIVVWKDKAYRIQ
jgi:hypothetical protein